MLHLERLQDWTLPNENRSLIVFLASSAFLFLKLLIVVGCYGRRTRALGALTLLKRALSDYGGHAGF